VSPPPDAPFPAVPVPPGPERVSPDRPDRERWEALAGGLPRGAVAILTDLVDELVKWNRKIKLTAPGTRDELARRLVDDSLLLVPFVRGPVVVDVGSGPGIPGLVLAAALPGVEVRTVESIAKKVAFTRSFAARHPGLKLRPFTGRAEGRADEAWAGGDTVLSRAFTAPGPWVAVGAPLVKPGGRLLVTLGSDPGVEADGAAAAQGLAAGGVWSGRLFGVTRAVRWYERPAG